MTCANLLHSFPLLLVFYIWIYQIYLPILSLVDICIVSSFWLFTSSAAVDICSRLMVQHERVLQDIMPGSGIAGL